MFAINVKPCLVELVVRGYHKITEYKIKCNLDDGADRFEFRFTLLKRPRGDRLEMSYLVNRNATFQFKGASYIPITNVFLQYFCKIVSSEKWKIHTCIIEQWYKLL